MFPFAVGNSDTTIPGAAQGRVSMVWDGDRQSVRAPAAATALESIPHMDLREGKVEDLPHQQTCFIVLFTRVLLLENYSSFIRSISHCILPSSIHEKIIILAGRHLIKLHCVCFGSHSMENLLLTAIP